MSALTDFLEQLRLLSQDIEKLKAKTIHASIELEKVKEENENLRKDICYLLESENIPMLRIRIDALRKKKKYKKIKF